MTKRQGPKFVQYFDKVILALKTLGGSGRPNEIVEYISTNYEIDKSEWELLSDGTSRLNKNINWARFYLSKSGHIDGSKRGVWSLTEKGRTTSLDYDEALTIFHNVQQRFRDSSDADTVTDDRGEIAVVENDTLEDVEHRESVLKTLMALPPEGFERLAQRLLRESGFEKVVVTGKSGDGGIDGQGILKINHFVSFQVCFQCKRYKGSVGSNAIRDFRGSIDGRADKGIIITTGTFTGDAKREASRDGAKPIELVDGEQLVDMLEELELGVIKKKTITIYEVDNDFFDEFRSK